jgi:hypothetical protein
MLSDFESASKALHHRPLCLARRASGLQQCDKIRVWGPSLPSRNGHELIIEVSPISGAEEEIGAVLTLGNEQRQLTTLWPKRKMNIW